MAPEVIRFTDFDKLEQRMDELVARLVRRPSQAMSQRAWAPRVDVYETSDEFIAVADLAGVASGEVTIEISGDEVSISGTRPHIDHPDDADCLQLEIPQGDFERRLVLPSPVDPTNATATFEEGLLRVILPKVKRGPQKVQVEIKQ